MNIQQNLNALLTMGAVAARTSESYLHNTAVRDADRQATYDIRAGKKITKVFNKNPELATDTNRELALNVAKSAQGNLEKLAQLKPTTQNVKRAMLGNNALDATIKDDIKIKEFDKTAQKIKAEQDAYQGQVATIETTRGQRLGVEDRLEILRNARKTYGGK